MGPTRGILLFVTILALAAWACTLEDLLAGGEHPDFVVNNGSDHLPGPCNEDDCTLREAIIAANESPEADIILLPPFNYHLDLEGADEDAAETGDLDILGDVIIMAADDEVPAAINAQEIDRVFHVIAGDVEFRYLTLRGGRAQLGGGLLVAGGTVRLESVTVQDNLAVYFLGGANGGGIYNFGDLTISASTILRNEALTNGGGIFNQGTLTIEDTTIEDNFSNQNGGGLYNINGATLQISSTTFAANESIAGLGGGLAAYGDVEITGTNFQNNTAFDSGGGLYVGPTGEVNIIDSFFQVNGAAEGGGLYGIATLTDVVFSANIATEGHGGGMFVPSSLPSGPSTATLTRVTFQDNETSPTGFGSGIYSNGELVVNESYFGNNGPNAALYSEGSLSDTTVQTTTFENNTGGSGGGIHITNSALIESVTVNNNEASQSGGLYLAGEIMLLNCTISGNNATMGGGVFITPGSSVQMHYCTLVGNSAINSNNLHSNGTLELIANILHDNGHPGSNCGLNGVTSGAENVDSDSSCGLSDSLNADPLLGTLQSNGGLTQTHALLPDSPALDAASASCPPADQRGIGRPQGASCDIGAYEAELSALLTPSVTARAIANENANCRMGPGSVYDAIDIFMLGSSAPIEGRDEGSNWVRLLLPNDVHCWVWVEVITIVGDFSGVPVLPAPPTPTPSPTPSFTPEPGGDEPEPTETLVPGTDTPIP